MDEFGVYAIFGLNGPPQRLAEGSRRVSAAVPPSARQVVLFSSGPWGDSLCVNAELTDAHQVPITIGKLTPYNKCLSWEQWEEETWTDGVVLHVSLEGGNMVTHEAKSLTSITGGGGQNHTFINTPAPLADRELGGKRKRGRASEEDSDGGGETPKPRGEENICPNGVKEKATPSRKAKGQAKSSNEPRETPAIVGGTPPQAGARVKSRQARTPTQTRAPSGRWGQTLCPIDAQTAILIGGQGARMQFCKDPMWKLRIEDMSWVAAETLAEGPTPEARIGHSAVFDPDSRRIFVFGGSKNRKWFNDVHILDTQSWRWTMVEAQGKVPPLAYHSCSMFRGELFVLGGVFPRPNPEPDGCSDSLYIFDPHLSIWYQPILTGDKPSPRSGHSACVIQERYIYVFGGWDTPVCYNDMYKLDLGLMEFSAVKTSGKAPSPRSWHGCAALSETKFLIHGGYNGNNALSDAFVFDTGENERPTEACWCLGGENEGAFFSDLTSVSVEELLEAA
uniref:Tip elongation aberrant protein 1-like n=1 Tax=Fundulus heteroclitus TaxID=8078 RepID=A0A3Q2U3A4_FUNHE